MEQFQIKSVFMQAPFVMIKETTQKELNPTVKELIDLARYHLNHKDGEQAVIKYYKDALILHKTSALFVEAAYAFFLQEKYYKAHEMLGKARELDKDCPEIYYNLALIFYFLGDYYSAESLFELIISTTEIAPEIKAYSHNFLSCIYLRFEQLSKARENLQEALTILPQFVPTHNNFALAELCAENLDGATEWLHKALAIDSKCIEALNNLGVIQVQKKNYAAALDYFKKAQPQEAYFYEAYRNAMIVTKMINDSESATPSVNQNYIPDTQHVHGNQCSHG